MKRGLWLIVIAIAAAAGGVLCLLIARQAGWVGDQTATIWGSAIGTIGTLAAVGVALVSTGITRDLANESKERGRDARTYRFTMAISRIPATGI